MAKPRVDTKATCDPDPVLLPLSRQTVGTHEGFSMMLHQHNPFVDELSKCDSRGEPFGEASRTFSLTQWTLPNGLNGWTTSSISQSRTVRPIRERLRSICRNGRNLK